MSTDAISIIRSTNGQPPLDGAGVLFDPARQEWLTEAADMGAERLAAFDLYESYYDGDHRVELTDRARAFLEASDLTFAENFCEPLVDAIAGRLSIDGFQVSRDGEPDDELTGVVNGWWAAGRMDAAAQAVHTQALILGEYFVLVDPGDTHPELVGNHPRMIRAVYADDDMDTPAYVVKVWNSRDVGPANPQGRPIRRMNVYFPDRIERYWTATNTGRGWDVWTDDANPVWPTPWTGPGGIPLGVPVAHFRNRPLGRPAGRSELRGDIPMQDLHNKLVVDLAMILDNQAWMQRWVTGQSKQNASFRNIPGEVWFFPSPDARVGSFPTDDAAGVLASIESLLSRRARRAQIPLHLLTGGDIPSGEAMRSAEAGLVKKVRARMDVFGDAWEDALRVALILTGVDVTGVRIETSWASPESRDELERADAALKWRDVGVSRDTVLEMNGFDVEQESVRRTDEESTGIGDLRALMGGVNERAPFPPTEEE